MYMLNVPNNEYGNQAKCTFCKSDCDLSTRKLTTHSPLLILLKTNLNSKLCIALSSQQKYLSNFEIVKISKFLN